MSRTSLDNLAIKAASVGPDLASLADGRYILPAFLPSPNCFMTIAGAFEVFRETPLSGVRKEFGDSFGNVFRERLEYPGSAKGRVMRGLAERFGRDPDAILAEGVLLGVDEGWVLSSPILTAPCSTSTRDGERRREPRRVHGRVRRSHEVSDRRSGDALKLRLHLRFRVGYTLFMDDSGTLRGFDWEEAEVITLLSEGDLRERLQALTEEEKAVSYLQGRIDLIRAELAGLGVAALAPEELARVLLGNPREERR